MPPALEHPDTQDFTVDYSWLPDLLHMTHDRAPQIAKDFIDTRIKTHTKKAYLRILKAFLLWAERNQTETLSALTTADIANYLKGLQRVSDKEPKPLSPRTRAQVLACVRGFFDALVRGGALTHNPASSAENYKRKSHKAKHAALEPADVSRLLDSIPGDSLQDLQDKTIIALMAYSCARIGAVVRMRTGDVTLRNGRLRVFLEEKGDKKHSMPCHPELDALLSAFLLRAGGLTEEAGQNPSKWLFRRWDKKRGMLTPQPLTRIMCWLMVKRRTRAIGLEGVTNHNFRATGITTFLDAGGALDDARRLANHSSVNTTKLYDHRKENVSLKDVEMIDYRRAPKH